MSRRLASWLRRRGRDPRSVAGTTAPWMRDAVDRGGSAWVLRYLGPAVFLAAFAFAVVAMLNVVGAPFGREHEMLVAGGKVFSGSSARERVLDIGIGEGRIAYLGIRRGVRARERLSARNLYVAPGFLDLECRAGAAGFDRLPTLQERALRQGVTTLVCGGDGTMGPREIREALAILEEQGVALNVAFLVGYDEILAPGADSPSSALRDGLAAGALGLAIGPGGPEGGAVARSGLAQLVHELDAIGAPWFGALRNPIGDQLPYDGLRPGDDLPNGGGDPATDPRLAGELTGALPGQVLRRKWPGLR